MIERATVVVRDDRIAAIVAGAAPAAGRGPTIDAAGMTLIAGYIDCHRHLINVGLGREAGGGRRLLRDKAPAQMRDLVGSGVTTV